MRLPRRVPPIVPHVDMRGRLCVVTGASGGIGLETARGLVQRGADVVAIGRSAARLQAAVESLKGDALGGAISGLQADFGSLADVRRLASELLARHAQIDVLVNNAGVWNNTPRLSSEGYEHTFAVNHLAPFLLTGLLLEALTGAREARVVNVSSRLHRQELAFDFDDVHQQQRRYAGLRAYRQSKLANVLFTRELHRRVAGALCVNAVHPGDVNTDVVRDSRVVAWVARHIASLWLLTPEEGARTSLYAATAPELAGLSGQYFAACRQVAPSPAAHDGAQAERLWTLSEELTGWRL